MKRLMLLLIFGMFLTTFVSADLGTVKQDDCIDLYQFCPSCTYVNYTAMKFPDGTVNSSFNLAMTKTNYNYNYTFCNTSAIGQHFYTVCGDKDGVLECEDIEFDVTVAGDNLSSGDSVLYSLFSIMLFGFVCIIVFFIITIPSENGKDDSGFETKVIRLKYLRPVLFVALYICVLLLLNFLNGIALNYTTLTMFAGILGFVFETMISLAWPFTILIIVWIVLMLIHDTNVIKRLDQAVNFDWFDRA